jgi:hypothetical protein
VANPQPVHELNVNTRLVGIRTGLQSQRTDGLRWRLREVAQFGSALRSGRRGRGFKSPLPDQVCRGACGRCCPMPRAKSSPMYSRSSPHCIPRAPSLDLDREVIGRPTDEQFSDSRLASLSISLDTVAG